jgi:hypothetical protein
MNVMRTVLAFGYSKEPVHEPVGTLTEELTEELAEDLTEDSTKELVEELSRPSRLLLKELKNTRAAMIQIAPIAVPM